MLIQELDSNGNPVSKSKPKMSQEELAELIGISRQAINAIEKEKFDPSLPTAFKMSRRQRLRLRICFYIAGPTRFTFAIETLSFSFFNFFFKMNSINFII